MAFGLGFFYKNFRSVKMKPLIIAHRGASGNAPENTLAAFQLSVEEGADGIELDVHLSKDGELVVIHDDTLDRTTNGTGRVQDKDLDELKTYDAGSWFDSKFASERIPLLQEVIDILPDEVFLNVEIKNSPTVYQGIEQKLVDILEKNDRLSTTVVSSFDHASVRKVKQLAPEVKIGLIYSNNFADTLAYLETFKDDKVYSLHPSHKVIYNRDIQPFLDAGLQVYPYTINDEEIAQHLHAKGVSGLITNYPTKIRHANEA